MIKLNALAAIILVSFLVLFTACSKNNTSAGAGRSVPKQLPPEILNPPNSISSGTSTGASIEASSVATTGVITGTTDSGDVQIELIPRAIKDGMLEVEIGANTHSVDLQQFDLKESTILKFEANVVKPVSAPQLSGHHSYGSLFFDVNGQKEIRPYTITIRGIPKVQERVYNWE